MTDKDRIQHIKDYQRAYQKEYRKNKLSQVSPPLPLKDKGYSVIDKRGIEKQITGLYPTPNSMGNWGKYRPRLNVIGDTKHTQTAYDRRDQIKFARGLFASMTDLGGALLSKASWCVSSGFSPVYTGTNKEWGDTVENWLLSSFYPVCNVLGPNFDFRTTLTLSSLSIDVDGDSGLLLTTTRSGFPQIQLIASHRIGQRTDEETVESGRFSGYDIADGIIYNDAGRAIGYRVLGDDADDDVDISAASLQLLYEPEWSDQAGHGISRIARSTLDWLDIQDINEYTKRSIKIASTIGLIHTTETGTPDVSAGFVGASEDAVGTVITPNNLQLEYVRGGEIYYMKAGTGEDIKPMTDERPSQNSADFMDRIQRRALFAVGWPVELLDPSKVGGASVRLIQDLARKTVVSRQITLERRARWIVNYAVAKAMNTGLIPQNNTDWYSWNFTKAGVLSVDNGNELQADREGYKLGTNTLADLSSKGGKDWYELREQQQLETDDLLTRATELSKKFNIGMDAALSLLSQRAPNQVPVTNQTDATPAQPTTK